MSKIDERTFDTEIPRCPFRQCDMRSDHDVIGCGWDFEYHTTREEISYSQCRGCKLIFPQGIPSVSALPVIYPPTYYSFKETDKPSKIVMAVRTWMAKQKGTFYKEMVPKDAAQVLDIGCGDGRLLDVLKHSCPKGWLYSGIDWSETAIERLKIKGYDGRSGNISQIDLSDWDEKFDLVIMHQLIEHVSDPRETLEKVKNLLNVGGVLSIETPDHEAWDFYLFKKRFWWGYHIPRHFYVFNKSNFTKLAHSVGFEVVSTKSLVNPVGWIHSIRGFFEDHKSIVRFAPWFHQQNVLLLALFTPLEIFHTRVGGKSSNMQVNLRKLK